MASYYHAHEADTALGQKNYLGHSFHTEQAGAHRKQHELMTKPQTAQTVHKSDDLEKRSKNVREQTRNITPEQAVARRVRYAQSIGLKPRRDTAAASNDFPAPPRPQNSDIGYGGNFAVEHETAHAMMTPKGQTIGKYQQELNSKAGNSQADTRFEPDEYSEAEAHDAENVANRLENLIDRRSGVGTHRSRYRNIESLPDFDTDIEDSNERWDKQEKSDKLRAKMTPEQRRKHGFDEAGPLVLNHKYKEAADAVVRMFDVGRKFKRGKPVDPKPRATSGAHLMGKSDDEAADQDKRKNTRRLLHAIKRLSMIGKQSQGEPPFIDDDFKKRLAAITKPKATP